MLQRVIILGDFNIHVCCPSYSLFASDFIKLLDSFDLTQHVKLPSHDKGHTLDIVLSHGFCVDDVNLDDFAVTDPNAVLFQVPSLSAEPKSTTLIHSRPLIHSLFLASVTPSLPQTHFLTAVNNMALP